MTLLGVALVPLLLVVAIWTARNPFRGLVLYALILPLGSSVELPLGLPDPFNTLSTLLGGLTGLLLLIKLVGDQSVRAPVPAVAWVWVMFLAVSALTYLWSIDRTETVAHLMTLVPLVGLYFLASMYRPRPADMRALEGALIAGGAAAGLLAVGMAATGTLYPSGTGVDRFYATGGDPNITAASLLVPFAIALGWATSRERPQTRTLGFVGAVLTALGVLLTVSRGGLLSLLVVIGLWLFFTRRLRLLWLAGAIAVLVFFFLPDDITERLTETSSTGRTDIWEVGVAACPEYCWVGAGVGTFPEVHQQTLLNNLTTASSQLRFEPHNIFLGAAVELGVAGLALLLVGLVLALNGARNAGGSMGRAAFSGLVGVIAANLLISNLEFKYFWLALTYVTLVSQFDEHSSPHRIAPLHIFQGERTT